MMQTKDAESFEPSWSIVPTAATLHSAPPADSDGWSFLTFVEHVLFWFVVGLSLLAMWEKIREIVH